ncbi:PilZ domain-containing protein [Desulfococcus sp.]|uniref:PilZ domain-containing protein n=1 Tax=Desulfococcus sp. TaxID=2025834 RepID=UPI003593E7CD
MTPNERRRHIRIDSFNLSYVSVDEDGSIVNQGIGRTLNVSESGILLETNFQTSLDQAVSLTIAFEENLIDLKGRFIHFKEFGGGIFQTGVEFQHMDKDTKAILVRYIQMFERSGTPSF